MTAHQNPQDRAAAGDQGGDRDQAGGLHAQGECRGDDGQRGRGQPGRAHRALDQHIGDQRPQRDDGLGAKAVVERHPRGEQDHGGRPVGGGAGGHRRTQPGQHLTRQQQPAHQPGNQVGQPHPEAGVGDMGHQRQQVVVPAERVLRAAEPAEVVGHVAGTVRDPGHAQDVAVVGGIRADQMPQQEAEYHRRVDQCEFAPAGRNPPVHSAAVQLVQAP